LGVSDIHTNNITCVIVISFKKLTAAKYVYKENQVTNTNV